MSELYLLAAACLGQDALMKKVINLSEAFSCFNEYKKINNYKSLWNFK